MPALTIGIIHSLGQKSLATTLRELRHALDMDDVELIVIATKDKLKTREWVKRQRDIRYVPSDPGHSPGALDQLFAEASGEVVLVLEGGVRLNRGALEALRAYFAEHPSSRDLVHGPLVDGKKVIATHCSPSWLRNVWGERARDPRGLDVNGKPFVIPMHEAGVFGCRRVAWPGLPTGWQGYGAEAGYLQERFRRGGAKVICLPGLRWECTSRRDPAPPRSPEAVALLRNHLAGAADLGFDTAYIALRFRDYLAPGEASQLRVDVLREHERDDSAGLPLVSCLLHAGRRVLHRRVLLEEAIESFLLQDYPHKELILFNDTPEQFLVCDAPGVRVVNSSARCPSLGDCYNAAAAFAQGDLLAPWGGTSINLPQRLSKSVAELGSLDVYRPDGCWYMLDGELDDRPAQPDGGQVAIYTKEVFRSIGGYPSVTLRLHQEMDAALDAWLVACGRPRPRQSLPPAERFTIIRRAQDDALYKCDPFLDPWQADGQLPVKVGRVILRPYWTEDYLARCQERLAGNRVDQAPAPLQTAFVLGYSQRGARNWFPREDQAPGQTPEEHLARVTALVVAATAAGGTHLVIPRSEAAWLSLHPHVVDYLTAHHSLVEAGPEAGVICALRDEDGARQVTRQEVASG